jgi:4'-phosphopantetheinyl transferase
MPITRIKYISPHAVIGIWRLDEPESFFLPNLDVFCVDPEQIDLMSHDNRRKEWIAGRYLVYQLTELMHHEFNGVYSDEFGKPHLNNISGHISISHAAPYVVAMLHTQKSCGVDIERIRPKLLKLAPKFLSSSELASSKDEVDNLAVLWGAKEALYKLHGRKQLIFKENLEIPSISFGHKKAIFQGLIKENDVTETVTMQYQIDSDFVLVFSN